MKQLLLILTLLGVVGCDSQVRITLGKFGGVSRVVHEERPTVNLPRALRQSNWLGDREEGSCVWATTVSLLRWQGRYNTAEWVRRNYGNGEYPEHWAALAEQAGIRYAMTTEGDEAFLEWACKTRRGAGVTVMGGAHMVALVHLDDRWAALLDNNAPSRYIWVPREMFLAEWRASHGWALTPVYAPCSPLPQ
jgi:hypothetical protein